MKKLVSNRDILLTPLKGAIVAVMVMISFLAQAQWTLTPEGFQDDESESKDLFVTIDMDQQTLYDQVRSFVIETYTNPGEVMFENGPHSLKIAGGEQRLIRRNSAHVFNMKYGLLIEMEDNLLKINQPVFELYTITAGKPQTLHLVYGTDLTGYDLGIYNPKGKLKSERAKADLETFFNGLTESLLRYVQTTP